MAALSNDPPFVDTKVDTESLLTEYRGLYWRHNEMQLAYSDFPSQGLAVTITMLEGRMRYIERLLGYVPEA